MSIFETLADKLRKSKLSYMVYNFFRKRQLMHNVPLYKKWGLKKHYYSPVNSSDFEGLPADAPWLDQKNSRHELPEISGFKQLPATIQNAILPWSDQGYVILNSYFNTEQVNTINSEVERLIAEGKVDWKANDTKIMFAIHESDYIKRIGSDPQLLNILSMLLGKEVMLFQSINFLMGSEQRTHSDSIHMTTFPQGYLIAVWVALEDINEDNGPLHYYPSSHKLPYLMNKDYDNEGNDLFLGAHRYAEYEDRIEEQAKKQGLEKKIFLAKKGDALIWHANLLHGGNPHLNKSKTRKSVVFHYYAKEVICYHEISQRPALFHEH